MRQRQGRQQRKTKYIHAQAELNKSKSISSLIIPPVYRNSIIASEVRYLTGIYAALTDTGTNFQTLMR